MLSKPGQEKSLLILLDQGSFSVLRLKDQKLAWTLHLPEPSVPQHLKANEWPACDDSSRIESKIVPSVYDPTYTAEILWKHQDVFYPEMGTFKHIFESSERIIHSPLRQQVWSENEIHYGNIGLIGDAARVMPPYVGQGI